MPRSVLFPALGALLLSGALCACTPRPRSPLEQMLHLDAPRPGSVVRSPLRIRGVARGPWYFEGTFPLRLQTRDGSLVARGVARAQGAWMTGAFVPFSATLRFAAPVEKEGELLLRRDNPSGLARLDDTLLIPVRFR